MCKNIRNFGRIVDILGASFFRENWSPKIRKNGSAPWERRMFMQAVPAVAAAPAVDTLNRIKMLNIWSEWRLTVIAATVRIALVDILDLSEVDIPAGGFLYPAVGWG